MNAPAPGTRTVVTRPRSSERAVGLATQLRRHLRGRAGLDAAALEATGSDSGGREQQRAGIDLVAASAITAVLGMVYWMASARLFDDEIVGINTALISTMVFVANLASLGFKNGLIRFLPDRVATPGAASRMVKQAYVATTAFVLLAAPAAILLVAAASSDFGARLSPTLVVGFTLATAVWLVFDLQDGMLVALGETRMLLAANALHSLAKLLLLVVTAWLAHTWGIFLAWVVPVIGLAVWANRRAFTRLAESDALLLADGDERRPPLLVRPAAMVRFCLGDHAGFMVRAGVVAVIPVFVLAHLGEGPAAWWGLSWAAAYPLQLMTTEVATALLAEASRAPGRLRHQTLTALKQMLAFAVPGAIALALLAPIVLSLFGRSYVDNATGLLRCLAVIAVVQVPVELASAILRTHQRVGHLLAMLVVEALIVGGLCYVLLDRIGLIGAGIAWIVGDAVIAVWATAVIRVALRAEPEIDTRRANGDGWDPVAGPVDDHPSDPGVARVPNP